MAAEAVCKYGARVLVTGAGRGIGLEFCRQLKDAGALVYATVRKESEVSDYNACRCFSHGIGGVMAF